MSEEYSEYKHVESGDTTTHTVDDDYTNIENVQCRWRGDTESETVTNRYENSDSGSGTIESPNDEIVISTTYPENPDEDFDGHGKLVDVSNFEHYDGISTRIDYTIEYEIYDDEDNIIEEDTIHTHFNTSDPYITISQLLTEDNHTGRSSTVVLTDFITEDDDDPNFDYENKRLYTRTEETIYHETENPTVEINNEETIEYDGVLENTEWSPWFDIDDSIFSEENQNEFSHSIDGSNKAYFEYEYTYEYAAPDPVAYRGIHVNDQTYHLPLAEVDDDALEYELYRFFVNGQVLVADLVDVDDDDTSPYRVKTPKGILAWRENIQ